MGTRSKCLVLLSAALSVTRRPDSSFRRERGLVLELLRIVAALGLLVPDRMTAQTLISFNSDGANPNASLILSGSTLYGTTFSGGTWGRGAVFAIHTDGTGFTNLHSFNFSDGSNPRGGLTNSGRALFGTTGIGGSSGLGTVFKMNTDGTGFTNLHSFTGSDGTGALDLVLSENTLYGATSGGGSSGAGAVFAINTDGTGFTNLYSFTNSYRIHPQAGLTLSGDALYGTFRGPYWGGAVFKIQTDGTGFATLHSFSDCSRLPNGGLIVAANTVYGTERSFHPVYIVADSPRFKVKTDGTGFSNLYSFSTDLNGGLIELGDTLYPTGDGGAVFKINTDGTGFTNFQFSATDQRAPVVLLVSGGTLYGTDPYGGSSGSGMVFKVNTDGTGYSNLHSFTKLSTVSLPPPELTVIRSGTNLVLTWPTDYTEPSLRYTLESSASLLSPVVWAGFISRPAVANGQNAVAIPISGPRQYYRLEQTLGELNYEYCRTDNDCPCVHVCLENGTCAQR